MNSLRLRYIAVGRRRHGDDGVTLIELLVTMFLMSVVSTLVLTAVVQASRVLTQNDDENTGLQDVKIILDRLGRDIREARSVVCDNGLADPGDAASTDVGCIRHLQLWVDYNSNYVQDHDEVVTWRLQKAADGVHYNVWRVEGDGLAGNVPLKKIQATSLVVNALFDYGGLAPQVATVVNLTLKYDALISRGIGQRSATFSAKLRNKG